MKSCPNCGASSFFGVTTKQCFWCGKITCDKCLPSLRYPVELKASMENIVNGSAYGIPQYSTAGFCSDNCYHQFWGKVQNYPLTSIIGTDVPGFQYTIINAWNQAILDAAATDYKATVQHAIALRSPQYASIPWWDKSKKLHPYYSPFYHKGRLALGENLEKCGRIQDAANIFESLQMYDKARELRNQDRHILVKNTTVSVNLNSLLQQVREGGIVAVFRCPHCGGKLKVNKDSTLDRLRICEHCQTEISTLDLADFLKTILNY